MCTHIEKRTNIKNICDTHSVEYTEDIHRVELRNRLIDMCREIIKCEEKLQRNILWDLSDQLALRYLVEKIEVMPYFQILQTLNSILQNGILIISIENDVAWSKVIRILLDVIKLEEKVFETDSVIASWHVRQYIVGTSAQYLQEKGYRFSVSNNRIISEDYKKIANYIESEVKSLGGVNVAERIFFLLQRFYIPNQKRFVITRNKTSFNTERKTNSHYPFGYLLQISLKNFVKYNHADSKQFERRLSELLKLSHAYVSTMDIQDYSMYGNMFFDLEKIVYYLQDNILYDHVIAFAQWNPDYIPTVIEGLLTDLLEGATISLKLSFKLIDFVLLTQKLLERGATSNLLKINRFEIYTSLTGVKTESIDEMLKLLSHKRKAINRNYSLPTDVSNFSQKPLIQLNTNEFLLLNPSLCAFSFYEAIANKIRSLYPRLNDELGHQIESYVIKLMKSKGIDCKSGFYSENSECDIVIETNERIVFIEMKMKPLTRKTIAGDGVNLFVDLSKGLIASQKQLGAHELYLRKNGRIVLRQEHSPKKSRDKEQVVIEHKNRIIERVSVVFTEYGFITDKQVVSAILETVTVGDVHTDDPTREHELNDLKKTVHSLREQSEQLKNYNTFEQRKPPYFDCALFSLQQILMIIMDSNSTDSFVENLLCTKHVSMSTNDFYFEYGEWGRIKHLT